ncbi:MAG: phosphatidate cytidylyltransferase [Lachnospiraceae bacterium]|nr:phosphatidate cytidylyltransferase [uncultured Acetatifactor sp.]MCI8542912.1 phosphatidate cytidylyltransferase [Lachnospiraceae bacterium]
MFWTRLASGIVLLIIAIGSMSYGGGPLAAILCGVSLVAFRELTKALKCAKDNEKTSSMARVPNGLEKAGLIGIICYYLTMYFVGEDTYLLMCIVGTFLAVIFVYVLTFPRYDANQTVAAVFSYLYAPVLLSFVYQTRMAPQGIYTVWMILISSWGCDTCAYAVGKLIGRKKIFPALSPKKSLEGCIGGVLGAALIGWLYGYFFVEKAFPDKSIALVIAVICGAGAVMSMAGDLAASAIKRNHDIKDYGKLIPGHGGIMDRFDSMIVTAPMTYFLTILMLV